MPPDKNLATNLMKFIAALSNYLVNNQNDNVLLCGDFNLPHMKWSQQEVSQLKKGSIGLQNAAIEFLDVYSIAGLEQYNFLANTAHNTLDVIFCNLQIDILRAKHGKLGKGGGAFREREEE
ncbi:unnamed protein product [Leptidea sinapis]|uniref:Endonuclease/exonuclease/phosphatase domain-containing protein n=1 Tax=Leptidea sinapis TaxID=189913 RepID=A0A5E4QSQ0_9NEOP|nr:unnamed protein product [Leptidea sinapis]